MRRSSTSRLLISGLSLASLAGTILLSCSDPNNDPGVIGRAGTANDGGSGGEVGGGGGDGPGGASVAGTTSLAGQGGDVPGPAGGGGVAGDAASGAAGTEPGAGAAAGGSAGEGGAETGLHESTPAELPDESAADYADNLHGIITGDTLDAWLESWTQNRPAAVTGKLVVLQVVPSVAASLVHVAPSAGVVSYLVPSAELTQVRDNGLSRIEAEIPDGPSADAFLKKYGIDATSDYVVLTFEQLGNTQSSIVQSVGRAWLLLRYWGYPKERLALLNGSVNWNATTHGLATSAVVTAPPDDGTSSVKDLRVDNTTFVIPLSSLLDIYKGTAGATPLANVNVIDARGGAEALGLAKATSTGKTDCQSYTGTGNNSRCSPPFEGRLKGASSVPWAQFLDTSANGFQFFSKAAVKAIFDTQSGHEPGQLTIQYCRTNMRSMVTGIVANVILGYPTRFYDTSFIEWSHLAYGPTPLTRVLPESSSFRTDLASLTEHANVSGYTPGGSIEGVTVNGWVDGPNYNADADISPTLPQVTPTATSTTLSVQTDRAYKQ